MALGIPMIKKQPDLTFKWLSAEITYWSGFDREPTVSFSGRSLTIGGRVTNPTVGQVCQVVMTATSNFDSSKGIYSMGRSPHWIDGNRNPADASGEIYVGYSAGGTTSSVGDGPSWLNRRVGTSDRVGATFTVTNVGTLGYIDFGASWDGPSN